MRILVLDGYGRNALAVIHALDEDWALWGAEVDHGRPGARPLDRLLRARRLLGWLRYPSPASDPDGFLEAIRAACRRLALDAVLPTGTATSLALARGKRALEAEVGTRMLVEVPEKLEVLADKWRAYGLFAELGVPTPPTRLAHPDDRPDAAWFPLVAKPRVADGARGIAFLANPAALEAFLSRPPDVAGNVTGEAAYVLQPALRGELHDAVGCSLRGRPVSLLTQRRLVTAYDFGGPGIVNQTTREPALVALAERVLGHLAWTGVMLFDFLRDREGRDHLLECNPRLWGTTDLAVAAGANVCQQLADVWLRPEFVARVAAWDVGMVYKWPVPECLFHCLGPPRSPRVLLQRAARVLRRHPPGPTRTNFQPRNLAHLAGIVLERVEALRDGAAPPAWPLPEAPRA